jgi:group I intron endonuclease
MPLGEPASFLTSFFLAQNCAPYPNRKTSTLFDRFFLLKTVVLGALPQPMFFESKSTKKLDHSLRTLSPMNEYQKVPGVYVIENTSNNMAYVGQAKNLADRYRQHKYRFNKGENSLVLQQAWDDYGSSSFVFKVLESGPELANEKKRIECEASWIETFLKEGRDLYNRRASFLLETTALPKVVPLALGDQIKHTQSEEYRQKISKINKGRRSNGIAIVYDNMVFLSFTEAEGSLKISRKDLSKIVSDQTNPLARRATPEEKNAEIKLREEGGISTPPSSPVAREKKRDGVKQKVSIHGKVYNSVTEAARAENVTAAAISKRLKTESPGYFYVNSNNQRFLKTSNGEIQIFPGDI